MESGFSGRFIRSVDVNRTVKDELEAAMTTQSQRRRISVTDLVNPKQAYFRWTHPEIQTSVERAQLMLSGTGFHQLFAKAISSEEFIEQFLEFEGIVGKVDIYEDMPTELKTTGSMPSDVVSQRPGYIDQLGMYCTMANRTEGRLLIYRRSYYGQEAELRAYDVEFSDPGAIASEMFRRRDALREAIEQENPASLPRCEWLTIGCDYSDICGCEEAQPLSRVVEASSVSILERSDVALELSKLTTPHVDARPLGLNDLVFPRKAAYAAQADEEGSEEQTIEQQFSSFQRQGFISALRSAIRFGSGRKSEALPVKVGSVTGLVWTHGGTPTILRSSRWSTMPERDRLAQAFPHYVDRLAFECALSSSQTGRLIVFYEAQPGEKWMVYDLAFNDLSPVRVEAERRAALLEAGGDPAALPACPFWMARFCEHAPTCGCGN